MPEPAWPRIADVLADALDLAGAARAAFLDGACRLPDGRPDTALRAEVEALLAAADATEFLSPVAALVSDAPVVDDLPPGTEIGPYRLGAVLGEGGMGVVYRAERADGAFERAVALKRLRPGPGRRALHARLQAERRTLARLEHPGIARLYDGGVSPDGTPYLAMELVEGRPITAYADEHRIGVRERVALLAQACDAVAYAHARLVVHRDLKPSNVLVSDGGEVKLLDFGIAKLLADEDTALATRTVDGALTPAYAAPEQLAGADVTTATDVYALGGLLYELLAGRRAFDAAGRSPADLERLMMGGAPPPSGVAPDERRRALRGDLDRIVQKAMAPEPERRYDAAAGLADDLRRYLRGLPVDARAPTAAYRVGRFVRRHRAASAAALAAVLSLTVGLGLALWQAAEARSERRTAERVNAFVTEMLASADPYGGRGAEVTVLDAADAAAARLGADLAGEPATEAAIRHTLASTYRGVGEPEKAEEQARRALALAERTFGSAHERTATMQETLGTVLLDRGQFAEADSVFERALVYYRRHPGPHRAAYASVLGYRGLAAWFLDENDRAFADMREAARLLSAVPEPSAALRRREFGTRAYLGTALYHGGQYHAADSVLAPLIDEMRAAPIELRSGLYTALSAQAWTQDYLGRPAAVLPLLEEGLAFCESTFGPVHGETGYALNDLAYYYQYESDEPERAGAYYRRALDVFREVGLDATVPTLLSNLASFHISMGRPAEAVPLLEEAVERARAIHDPDHLEIAFPLYNLARAYLALGEHHRAEPAVRRALVIRAAVQGHEHVDTARAWDVLGAALHGQGRHEEAERALRSAYGAMVATLGPDHREVAHVGIRVAEVLLERATPEDRVEAEDLLEHAAGTLRGVLAERSSALDRQRLERAEALLAQTTGRR